MKHQIAIDIATVLGLAGIGYGLWMIYRPAAPLGVGVALLTLAVIGALRT